MMTIKSVFIISLLFISVLCEKETCSRDGKDCTKDGKHKLQESMNPRRYFPGLKAIINGDYQFPTDFFTGFCESMGNKHGDAGLYYNWMSGDKFVKRLCSGNTAEELNKLVPCINDKQVRSSFVRAISNMPNIPEPSEGMTEEEAQKGLCSFLSSSLTKLLKILHPNCDQKGFHTMVKLVTDILQNSEDYNIPLLNVPGTCVTDLKNQLNKQFEN
ncbi:uncharacterized protein LOC133194606 [Saccostrea echinata]|uniref:uncharacterized protein LOC133194606 n=1 Tax=Saccostrea echinata TaxID=191078 RepID=UPI002A81D9D1|nr:uncharacterized protein LOC133194606 [Saccostrea echinata]